MFIISCSFCGLAIQRRFSWVTLVQGLMKLQSRYQQKFNHLKAWPGQKNLLPMWLIPIPGKLMLNISREFSSLPAVHPQGYLSILPTWQLTFPGQMIPDKTRWKLWCLLWPSLIMHTSSFSHYLVCYTDQTNLVWEGNAQRREYKDSRIIESHFRGCWLWQGFNIQIIRMPKNRSDGTNHQRNIIRKIAKIENCECPYWNDSPSTRHNRWK